MRGSFTGAYRDSRGLLETADGGTVFLDEVGEMSLRMQALLLRFLETGEIQRVGVRPVPDAVDVRVISATNRDLLDAGRNGQFREDLYYRLNVVHFVMPPLRERREDIAPLLRAFPRAVRRTEPARRPCELADEARRLPRSGSLAGQHPRAAKCRRAGGPAIRGPHGGPADLRSQIRRDVASAAQAPRARRDARDAGASSSRRARAALLRADHPRPRIVLDGGVPAVHVARRHPRDAARRMRLALAEARRQLPDRCCRCSTCRRATTSAS